MGNLYKKIKTTGLALLLLFMGMQHAKACDRSRLIFDSVAAGGGGTFNIYLTLCVGGGILGSDRGADGNTGRFIMSFSAGAGFTVNSWTPNPGPTSDTLGTTYPGVNVGPQPAFNAQQAIYFNNSSNWYSCVNSTAACGLPHTDCTQLIFNTNSLPDSIRVYGIEGGDNFFDGCYPNITMLIDFTSLPVSWAHFDVTPEDGGVNLEWTTISETENSHFEVLRSIDGQNYESIGDLAALGSAKVNSYEFFDPNPMPGVNYYRVRQVDFDGTSTTSKTISVTYAPPMGMAWREVAPVPSNDFINLSFHADEDMNYSLQVFDLNGRAMVNDKFNGSIGVNQHRLDVRQFEGGIYYVRILSSKGMLERKIVVAH